MKTKEISYFKIELCYFPAFLVINNLTVYENHYINFIKGKKLCLYVKYVVLLYNSSKFTILHLMKKNHN